MSLRINSQKRGEWLELMPGKLPLPENGDRFTAALIWLKNVLGVPSKLLQSLETEGGIKLAGDRLRLHLFPSRQSQYEPHAHELTVLYEDEFCLVVHKPVGVKVHPDGADRRPTLANMVTALYSERNEAVAPAHIHRLDEYTSGPVLYAKNDYAHLKLDEAMARKEIGRSYVAFVQGVVDSTLTLIDQPIGKDRHHNQRRRVSPSGKPAVTRVEVIEHYPSASLVRLKLETGRTHQVRVHMSYAGHPLLGDGIYGGSTSLIPHQALHGENLSFRHPLTGEMIHVSDSWPTALNTLREQLQVPKT